ncbi:MAG: vitamin K epoxide reductase family protein [Anaerolineales bacterium]
MLRSRRLLILLATAISALSISGAVQLPVVQAILFFSPTCPHCHEVMTNDLPPLMEIHGAQLEIANVDTTTNRGQQLYQEAIAQFQIPEDRRGVPALIIGDTVLVGSLEIPQLFPGLVEQALEAGGIAWPAIPGIESSIQDFPLFGAEEAEQPSVFDRIGRDPIGNGLAILVLGGMLYSLYHVLSAYQNRRRPRRRKGRKAAAEATFSGRSWSIPILSLIGLGISIYLFYITASEAEAFCGPLGDCNAVQTSEYAKLFGLIPVGLIGVLGFGAILVTWMVGRFSESKRAASAIRTLLWLTVAGTLFSLYLTFLEPFVIGATCSWCLVSALLITALLWLAGDQATASAN